MDLEGTVAIVTGGSGGLGGRIAHALSNVGAHLAIAYNGHPEDARTAALEARDRGVKAETVHGDVTDQHQVEALVSEVVDKFGHVDILVNNAAYNKWIPFADLEALTHEEWDKIIATNLTGPMLLTKAVAGPMRRQGNGRIGQYRVHRRTRPYWLVHSLRSFESRPHPPHPVHGRGARPRGSGQLRRSGTPRRHQDLGQTRPCAQKEGQRELGPEKVDAQRRRSRPGRRVLPHG